jgi:hypothetical protein
VVDETPSSHVADEEALNSDVEGGDDSEVWYTESVEDGTEEDDFVEQAAEDDDAVESHSSGNDSDGVSGVNLLRLQKLRAQRKLQKKRFKAAKARMSRDWKATTTDWDTLTNEEMEVFAMDVPALQKMRVDGWDFGTFGVGHDVVYTTCSDSTCCTFTQILPLHLITATPILTGMVESMDQQKKCSN